MFRYGQSIFCLPHWPEFSYFFDVCLHWVSVVCGLALLDTSPHDLCIMTLMTLKLTAVPLRTAVRGDILFLRCLEIFINLADLKFRNCRHNNFSVQWPTSPLTHFLSTIENWFYFTGLWHDMLYIHISNKKKDVQKSLSYPIFQKHSWIKKLQSWKRKERISWLTCIQFNENCSIMY